MAYYYRSITIDHTKCGSGDSTNFPVLISGTYSYLATVANGGKVTSSSGYDIQFYSDSGLTTALKFQRVNWVAASGLCEFWVKVPTVSASTDTVIYIKYGDSSVTTDQQDAPSTWDSNYKGVWLLGDGATLSLSDSTSNANTLTNIGSCAATTGINNGGAVQINAGGSGQGLSPSNISGIGDFTWSAWGYATTNGTNAGLLWADDHPASPRSGVGLKTYRGASSAGAIEGYNGAGGGTFNTFTAQSLNTWHYYVLRRTGSTISLRIDGSGSDAVSGTMGSGSITLSNIYFGLHYYSGAIQEKDYQGKIGQVKLSTTFRSDSWLTSSYNNQNSPSTFYTLGSEVGGSVFLPRQQYIKCQAVNRASNY